MLWSLSDALPAYGHQLNCGLGQDYFFIDLVLHKLARSLFFLDFET